MFHNNEFSPIEIKVKNVVTDAFNTLVDILNGVPKHECIWLLTRHSHIWDAP